MTLAWGRKSAVCIAQNWQPAEAGVEYDGRAALSDAVQMQAVTADVYCCPEGG